ncbi:hypothetical protein CW304_17505 [Bacillus sp. UFRGS-B20]|nr:hypothetical protein CW304_17505 [Bacillus sp. UFRGS-B20]
MLFLMIPNYYTRCNISKCASDNGEISIINRVFMIRTQGTSSSHLRHNPFLRIDCYLLIFFRYSFTYSHNSFNLA